MSLSGHHQQVVLHLELIFVYIYIYMYDIHIYVCATNNGYALYIVCCGVMVLSERRSRR